ncbi:MAG: hypothetical protein COA90_01580 [Gammaproteobacteria bacterium]|nr:MAG: hypothetical protein COA90_01580 [Gammaproteobacteria bacterium]
MLSVTSTGVDTTFIASKQTTSTVATESVSQSNTISSSDNTSNLDKVDISTRAQKIQQLNEEFFSNGIKSFKVTQDFIARLEEYEFITAEEATSLGTYAVSNNSNDDSTVSNLSSFINSFTADIKEEDPNNSIIGILQQAQTVLDNFNAPSQSSLKINIPQISSQLQSYIDSSEQLSDTDSNNLNQLVLALNAANILTPGTNTTTQIDSYLAITKL